MAAKETNLQRKKETGEISEIQGRDLHTHGENFPGARSTLPASTGSADSAP